MTNTAVPSPAATSDRLLELSCGHVVARALHVVAELGVADLIDEGPRTAPELAAAQGWDADALDRLLRLLATEGVFMLDDAHRWTHTATSLRLSTNHPASQRGFVQMNGTPFSWGSFAQLRHSVESGEPAILSLHPDGLWAYLEANPDEAAVFQRAMADKSHTDIEALLAAHDFGRYRCVVDVGGGSGHLVRSVVERTPGTQGVLFELPEVAQAVAPAPGLQVVAGDFFTDDLPDGDCYLLMNIIHDWADSDALTILRGVARAAARRQATVLLVEAVLPDDSLRHWSRTLDVMMLALTGGRERTRGQYASLLAAAGLSVEQVTPTVTAFSVVEAVLSRP